MFNYLQLLKIKDALGVTKKQPCQSVEANVWKVSKLVVGIRGKYV